MGERRVAYGVMVRKQRERDNLEDISIWEDNIKIDLLEVRCGGMDWIELA